MEIYLSCSVPYSHLTKRETRGCLVNIFQRIKENKTQSLVVVDVLGCYSIEWIKKWEESRWNCRMSFIAEDGNSQKPMMMTCYYASKIRQMTEEVSQIKVCKLQGIRVYDHHIMAGYNTLTL